MSTSAGVSNLSAFMGWTTNGIVGGGDFHLTTAPDEMTPNGPTLNGVDQHNTGSYRYLNTDCMKHYVYNFSNAVLDADAAYKVNVAQAPFTQTASCDGAEGNDLALIWAVR